MSKNYIDSILSKLNNKLSCIWISGFIFIDKFPSEEKASSAFLKLVQEYPKLNSYYDEELKQFCKIPQKLPESIFYMTNLSLERWTEDYISHRIELEKDLPIRLGFVEFSDGIKLFFIQLHHAIGDGRTFTFLIQRYLELLQEDQGKWRLSTPNLNNKSMFNLILKNPQVLLLYLNAKNRISSIRGNRLIGKKGNDPLTPNFQYRIYEFKNQLDGISGSKFYHAAMIYAMAKMLEQPGIIRIRMPIDVRSELKLPRAFGNLCPCFCLEFDSNNIINSSPQNIIESVYTELRKQYFLKAHHTFHFDGVLYDRLFDRFSDKIHDFFQEKRSNTMVLTYMGDMAKILNHAPFAISNIAAHTPTWGAIGLKLNNKLVFNLNSFKGIWSNSEFEQFFSYIDHFVLGLGFNRLTN